MKNRATGAEQVQAWLARQLPGRPHPPVKRPVNWLRWASTIVIILGFGTVMATASPYVLPVIQNRNIWASISLVSILLFTSGHMFNHIRKVPYVAGDGKGGISYFAGGFQTQFGLETQIIAALCKSPWKALSGQPLFLGILRFDRWTARILCNITCG